MRKEVPTPWTSTANSWQYTTIYDASGSPVCRFDLEDWGVDEDNQERLEQMQADVVAEVLAAVNGHAARSALQPSSVSTLPVAWQRFIDGIGWKLCDEEDFETAASMSHRTRALYARPPGDEQAASALQERLAIAYRTKTTLNDMANEERRLRLAAEERVRELEQAHRAIRYLAENKGDRSDYQRFQTIAAYANAALQYETRHEQEPRP